MHFGVFKAFAMTCFGNQMIATLIKLWLLWGKSIPEVILHKFPWRKTKAMTVAPWEAEIQADSQALSVQLFRFSILSYRARPSSLRASSNMQSAINTSSPALARSIRSRSCWRSRMESASAAACCTSPSSAPRKGHRREPSSATSGEARWGTWIMGFSHLPAGQGQILYLVLNMSCIDDLASQPVSTPLCQKSISTLMTQTSRFRCVGLPS